MASVQESNTAIRRRASRGYRALQNHWFEYLLFGPTLLFLLIVLWVPFLNGVWMSFHDWPLVGERTWIGLGNYIGLLTWEPFHTSLRATAVFSLTTVIQIVTAIAAALLVKHRDRLTNVLNVVFILPYTMPGVVIGSIWMFLLNPTFGPFQKILLNLGLLQSPIYWQSNGEMAMAVVMFVTSWKFWPFAFLVIYATLENIPEAHYEAARMYGANRWQSFFRVTLPQLRSAIVIAFSIRFVWNLVKVAVPLQMTGGGPGFETSILAVFLYQYAREAQALGQAYTVGLILFAICLVLIGVVIRNFTSSDTTEVGA
jgi:ABC-type sugar transport system permease subunit